MRNSSHLFLLNIPVPIRLSSGFYISIKTPSVTDYESGMGYRTLAAVFETELENLEGMSEELGFISSHYIDLFAGLAMTLKDGANPNNMENLLAIEALERLCGVSTGVNGPSYQGALLTEEDILLIKKVYFISLRKLDIDGNISAEVDAQQKQMDEAQAKIDRIRGRNTNISESKETPWTEVVVMLMYYLGLSPREIKDLNYYGLQEMFHYANKAQGERIGTIAAGNGLAESYKNITQP